MPRVVFLLVPDVHLLEIAAPAQVFSTATDLGLAYTLCYVAAQPRVATVQGVALTADTQWPDLDREDLLIVPGWRGPTRVIDAATTKRLRAHHAAGGTVASVCAGADALGRAGLLDGRRCTTHHTVQEELARRYPAATVVRDVLYVSDDRVVTCAGAASATDLALHLLSTRHGPSTAATVARTLVVHSWRDGTADQESAVLRYRSHRDETVIAARWQLQPVKETDPSLRLGITLHPTRPVLRVEPRQPTSYEEAAHDNPSITRRSTER